MTTHNTQTPAALLSAAQDLLAEASGLQRLAVRLTAEAGELKEQAAAAQKYAPLYEFLDLVEKQSSGNLSLAVRPEYGNGKGCLLATVEESGDQWRVVIEDENVLFTAYAADGTSYATGKIDADLYEAAARAFVHLAKL